MMVSHIELSVGLRSAARLMVLRGREDLALRRETVARVAPFGDDELTTAADAMDRINRDLLCLACVKEGATGTGVLPALHSCVGIG
jgi:hypothetical protein